jgi:hypothetical protein
VEVNAAFKLYKEEVDVGLSGHGDLILTFIVWTTTERFQTIVYEARVTGMVEAIDADVV